MAGERERHNRRAALRAVYQVARDSSDRRPEALHRVLETELARRGVELTPAQLDAAVAAFPLSPAGVAGRLVGLNVRLARTLIDAARAGHLPRWAEAPNDAHAYDWPEESGAYFAAVAVAAGNEHLIERMLSDCPRVDHPAATGGAKHARLVELWFDQREIAAGNGTAPVHVGRQLLGSVSGTAADTVGRMLASLSSPKLSAEGYLAGDDLASARIDIELPTKP